MYFYKTHSLRMHNMLIQHKMLSADSVDILNNLVFVTSHKQLIKKLKWTAWTFNNNTTSIVLTTKVREMFFFMLWALQVG